jgi:hypothetical protein
LAKTSEGKDGLGNWPIRNFLENITGRQYNKAFEK